MKTLSPSCPPLPRRAPFNPTQARTCYSIFLCSLLTLTPFPLPATPTPPSQKPPIQHTTESLHQHAKASLKRARQHHTENSPQLDSACNLGKATFEYAEWTETDTQRAHLAEEGIKACRLAITLNKNHAPAHYYLALNLGQLARTRGISALRLVREMEDHLKTAIALDESLDSSGPGRILGQLYLDAPSWPASIGNRQKARQHLERNVTLFPNHPGNRLDLAEALIKWRQPDDAKPHLDHVVKLKEATQNTPLDITLAIRWHFWDRQLNTLQTRIQ